MAHHGDEVVRLFLDEVRTETDERSVRAARLAQQLVEGCDGASVTRTRGGARSSSPAGTAATDDLVLRADELQQALGEGPCLEAVRSGADVVVLDLAGDPRFPRWSEQAARLGWGSSASFVLVDRGRTWGSLNLYAARPQDWAERDVLTARLLARALATTLADADQLQHLRLALESRTTIGQAQGLLMERLDLDAEAAFHYLRRVSQTTHRRLSEIAADLVATRRLPDVAPPAPPSTGTAGAGGRSSV